MLRKIHAINENGKKVMFMWCFKMLIATLSLNLA